MELGERTNNSNNVSELYKLLLQHHSPFCSLDVSLLKRVDFLCSQDSIAIDSPAVGYVNMLAEAPTLQSNILQYTHISFQCVK